ncbi:MAG TPA: MFS transporter [Candidatus Limnocylindria bacterium]|jgi:MFS family permease|nr:MFS transporter [Candidatus Limnocylindria bacterium]
MTLTAEAPPSYRRLFTIEGFPRLVVSMLLARTATTMVELILVLFALERFQSPGLAGTVTFLSLFPGLMLSPIAGALLDRHGRTRLMVVDYVVAGGALALVTGLGATGLLNEVLLLLIVTVMSLTFPLSTTGVRTMFPLIVPRHLWERANAIDSNGYVVSSIFGPAIAGALVATVGSLWALALTAAMYAVAAVITVPLRDPLGSVPHGRLLGDAWAGLLYTWRNAALRGLGISVSIANVANGLFYIGLPVLVLTRIRGDAAQVGQLFALMGVAAAISVLFVGRVGTEGRERQLLAGSMLVAAVGYALVLVSPTLAFAALALVLMGLATGPFDVVLFTLRQRRTDPAWLGRAFAVSMSLNFVGFPIGSAVGGAVVGQSLEAAFLAAVALNALAAVVVFLTIPAE